MKKFQKIFFTITIIFAVLTTWQYFSMSKVILKKNVMKDAYILYDYVPPPASYKYTPEDLQRLKEQERKEKAEERKEKLAEELALKTAHRDDMKLYFGFSTTVLSSLVSVILVILNKKKD